MTIKLDNHINYLLTLKSACNAGLVTLSKSDWDELDYHDGLFMLYHEIELRSKGGAGFGKKNIIRG